MGPICPESTLVIPGALPIPWTVYAALNRYNLKEQALEDATGATLEAHLAEEARRNGLPA